MGGPQLKINEQRKNKQENFDFKSEFILTSVDARKIYSAYLALKPETTVEISPRAKVEIFLEDNQTLKIVFKASDFTSLRAIIGSYFRWVDAVLSTIRAVVSITSENGTSNGNS